MIGKPGKPDYLLHTQIMVTKFEFLRSNPEQHDSGGRNSKHFGMVLKS